MGVNLCKNFEHGDTMNTYLLVTEDIAWNVITFQAYLAVMTLLVLILLFH